MVVGLFALAAMTAPVAGAAKAVPARLVGWWLNPTPNNAWLLDGRTEFSVSEQGGASADGDWPEFTAARFVKTNGNYGYGCACLRAVIDGRHVTRLDAAISLPLRRCRTTAALRSAEPREK
jgi:hypothetical protein